MKRLILLYTLPFLMPFLHAQPSASYHPFIEKDKEWTVAIQGTFEKEPHTFENYYFESDTMINGSAYKKWMMCRRKVDGTVQSREYVGALMEKDQRVWIVQPNTDEAKILYDFGTQAGMQIVVSHSSEDVNIVVEDVRTITYRGKEMRCTTIQDDYDSIETTDYPMNVWIEGVGSWKDPRTNCHANTVGATVYLEACTVGKDTIYTNRFNPITRLAEIRNDNYYEPMVVEGKRWITGTWGQGKYERCNAYYFEGDTIIGGQCVHKLQCRSIDAEGNVQQRQVALLFEQDRKVWAFVGDCKSPVLLYDFGSYTGDTTTVTTISSDYAAIAASVPGFMSYSGLYKCPSGLKLKRTHLIIDTDRHKAEEWIAGIGSRHAPLQNVITGANTPTEILAVCMSENSVLYQDDFEVNRLNAHIPDCLTAIRNLPAQPSAEDSCKSSIFNPQFSIYSDLSGRHLSAPPAKGIYIENGKKRAMR